MLGHVRKLAIDFVERPVHEPSNCRLVRDQGNVARLLQFDGQHKTTAQILIGRKTIPMKVYVEPPIDMLQSLVIKIQQEIKKQPLTKSETLAKIGDVIKRKLEGYSAPEGKFRSEAGFIASTPKGEQTETKNLYFDELRRIIFFDEDNALSKAFRPGAANQTLSEMPTTDKVVIDKVIGPLLFPKPLDIDMDAAGGRDEERSNLLFILNAISERMLPNGWNAPGNDIQRQRAENFFLQGSIGWWMSEILIPSLKYLLYKLAPNTPLLMDSLDEGQKERIVSLLDTLCGWPIWSTTETEKLAAMRSNTVQNVRAVFPEYTSQKLLEETLSKNP